MSKTEKLDFKAFKKEALKHPDIKEEYDSLKPYYEIKKALIKARKQAGLTQEEIAKKLNTKKSNISRLESFNSKTSPRLSTIINYAKALGLELEIKLIKNSN
jgi:ribosome-binding protein aMBF1 (putative translation factor)